MSDNFDWRTEEDSDWDGAQPPSGGAPKPRRWLWSLAIVAALILAGGVVFWQARERLTQAEAARGDEIKASFYLIREAAEDGDKELFRNLLSGSDLDWAIAQQELFTQERLFDLRLFGLGSQPESLTDVEVILAPHLNSAEVSAVATYTRIGQEEKSEPVRLRQSSVFRPGARWVWSPPRDEYWGTNASVEENYLAVSYPQRDEALVLRLARDLDSLVGQMCEGIDQVNCPDSLRISVTFSHDPAILVEMGERFDSQGVFGTSLGGRSNRLLDLGLTVPTPSLLGIPLDDASYRALLNGYATYLVTGLAGRLVDEECCGTEARYRAAMRATLRDFGLLAWSLAPDELSAEVAQGRAQARWGTQNQVALLCSDGFERVQRMYLLDLVRGSWQEQSMEADLIAVKAMPSGDGVLLLGQLTEEDGIHSQVWLRSGEGDALLFDMPVTAAEAAQVNWEVQERQERLVMEIPDVRQGYSRYFTIDLEQCRLGNCPSSPESTVSRPVWSPDGSQLMVRAYGMLWWRLGISMVPIAEGTAPFWVDDDTYGYAQSFGREQSIVLVNTEETNRETVVLTTDDLREALGPDEQPRRLLIGRVIVSPDPQEDGTGNGRWLILAFEVGRDGAVNQARFFAYDPDTDEVTTVEHSGRLLSFNMTPGGDRLAIGGFDEDENRWLMSVAGRELAEPVTLPLESGGSAGSIPSYSWSQDAEWLLMLEQGLLTLFQPESGVVQKVRPPEPGCVQAAWYGNGGVGSGQP